MTGAEVAARIARIHGEAESLAALDVSGVDAVEAATMHRRLKAATDRLGLAAARLLARVEADGRWEASGSARTFPEWAARRQGSSVGAARREVTLGKALDSELQRTRDAVVAGEVTLEHADVLARIGPTSPARRAALASDAPDRNETYLLARARAVGVDEFRREARRWAAAVDAEAAELEHERASTKEFLTVARRDDGVALQGFLTHEHGTALLTALRAVSGVPARDDDRTMQQRDGAALGALARLVLDQGLSGGGRQIRPHLSVHVSWETFRSLAEDVTDDAATPDGGATTGLVEAAELDDGLPIARSVLERIACDSDISRIVFGPAGQVIDVGRKHRTYAGHLRRAVIARDRTCQHPGCTAPPWLGEVHHVEHWARGGRTSVANGILLCWYHHDLVHRRRLQIRPRAGGGWEFLRADGTPIPDDVRTVAVVEGPRPRPGSPSAQPAGGSPGGSSPPRQTP